MSSILNRGGAERFISTLLQHLNPDGFRTALCLLQDDIGFALPEDVPVHILDYHSRWHIPRVVAGLRRLLDESRPNVVLSNLFSTGLFTGMALRFSSHQPAWIARISAHPVMDKGCLISFLARTIYPRADRVVVNSKGLIGSTVHRLPFVASRLETLANPTDFAAIDRMAMEPPAHLRSPRGSLLIAVGRLGGEKRYDTMLEALRRVRERHEVTLWICGDGPRRDTIVRQIRRLHLEGSVRLLGYCPNPYALMRQADIFLLSSETEGLPNALIEAQGLGLPAVSTRWHSDPHEIIEDGKTGILAPVGDAVAMAEAISILLSNADARHRMGTAARDRSRTLFAAAPLTRAWENLLRSETERHETTS